jgi:hypothetical protein
MRYIPVFLLFLPLCSIAQDCKLKKNSDPYTKEIRLSTGLISLQGTSLAIEADSKEIDFFFSMDGKEKCFNDASTAIVVYEGVKVKATFRNGGPVNCDGFFHILFKNGVSTPPLLQRLTTQKIISIQLTGTNKTLTTVTLSTEEQEKIIALGNCLVKEAKTLLK